MPALAVASASTQMRGRVGLWSHMRAPLSLELSACRNQKITTIRQFAFPPLAPTHRSGRLVHKNGTVWPLAADNPHPPER